MPNDRLSQFLDAASAAWAVVLLLWVLATSVAVARDAPADAWDSLTADMAFSQTAAGEPFGG